MKASRLENRPGIGEKRGGPGVNEGLQPRNGWGRDGLDNDENRPGLTGGRTGGWGWWRRKIVDPEVGMMRGWRNTEDIDRSFALGFLVAWPVCVADELEQVWVLGFVEAVDNVVVAAEVRSL